MGYSQSLLTTIWGLTIFLFAAIVWFILYGRQQDLLRRGEREAAESAA
jgi:hypothetical protein